MEAEKKQIIQDQILINIRNLIEIEGVGICKTCGV
jgi:hypothetical protein